MDKSESLENFVVRCGEYDVKEDSKILPQQDTRIEKLIFHPDYDPTLLFLPNNLVILRTKKNFIYQKHIGPVCLPTPSDVFDNEADCWSSGWGKDQFGSGGKYSDILKKINMNIVPHPECNDKFNKTRLKGSFKVDKSQLCVGGVEGKDTCTGDGGSPHVCVRDGKYVQVN